MRSPPSVHSAYSSSYTENINNSPAVIFFVFFMRTVFSRKLKLFITAEWVFSFHNGTPCFSENNDSYCLMAKNSK